MRRWRDAREWLSDDGGISYLTAKGEEQLAFMGVSKTRIFITAAIDRLAPVYWRVDAHPYERAIFTRTEGAGLSHRRSTDLLAQMQTGDALEVRFRETDTGTVIEKRFALDAFRHAASVANSLVLPAVATPAKAQD
jgi:hypothetical protein